MVSVSQKPRKRNDRIVHQPVGPSFCESGTCFGTTYTRFCRLLFEQSVEVMAAKGIHHHPRGPGGENGKVLLQDKRALRFDRAKLGKCFRRVNKNAVATQYSD